MSLIQLYTTVHLIEVKGATFSKNNEGWLIDWLIDWCLTPTLAVFQLYRGVFWRGSYQNKNPCQNIWFFFWKRERGELKVGRLCTFITFSDGLRTMRTAIKYKSYGKRDYINLPMANFPLICSNIVTYGVCVSQLLRYCSMRFHSIFSNWKVDTYK